jgi:hypothetical protein
MNQKRAEKRIRKDHQLNGCMGKLQDVQASSNLSICSQKQRLVTYI